MWKTNILYWGAFALCAPTLLLYQDDLNHDRKVSQMNSLGVPNLRDELERKGREHLVHVLYRLQSGEIGLRYAHGALEALWGLSAGLVSNELRDDIASAINFVEAEINRIQKAKHG